MVLWGLLHALGWVLPAALGLPLFGLAATDQTFYDNWWTSAQPALLPGHSNTYSAAFFGTIGDTREVRIAAGVAAAGASLATTGGIAFLWIPNSMLPYDITQVPQVAGVRLIREDGNPSTFDIQAYGAARSGADATAGIQAAMDAASAAGGGIVFGAAGTYNYTTLRFYSLVTLQGAGVSAGGVSATVFYQGSAAAPLLQPNNPAVGTKGFTIRDIAFSCFGNANNTGGLDFTGCSLFDVDRVHVSGCKNFGVQVVGIAPAGNSGFANFSRVVVQSLQTAAVAWLFGSNTILDQPDGLNFWGCYTNVAADVVVIRSTAPVGGHGPSCHVWSGCRFELGNAGTQLVLDVDVRGYGADFLACRFETFGANQTYNLVGTAFSGGIAFYRTTRATSGGTITDNDTGVIPTQWIACGAGANGVNPVATLLDGLSVRAQTVTGNVTLNGFTTVTLVDATAGAVTISLPDPTQVTGSLWFRIIKKDASANAVTINAGGALIDGVTTKVMHAQYQGVDVVSDGTNWFSVAAHGIALGVMELMPFSALQWGDGGTGRGYLQVDGTPKFVWSLGGTTQMTLDTSLLAPTSSGGKLLGSNALPFGDIVATGGFRQSIDGWFQENAAASQVDVVLTRLATTTEAPNAWIAARAGSVTGIWVKMNTPRTAGTLTVKVFKNGAQLGTLTAVLDGTNTTFKATLQNKDTGTFVAGDELDIRVTTDAGWTPVTGDIRAGLEVET